jgi:AcrR family transcriptional regulator
MPLPRFDKLDDPKKSAILGAAAAEFGDRGFEGASYNRIISRAGISKGAMYYYFADKDDLYVTVLRTALTVWFTEVVRPFEAVDAAGFWRECESIYSRSLQFMMKDPANAALCLSITNARMRLEGHPILIELNERMTEFTRALITQGQALGAVRDDLPEDLLTHGALGLMDAGDRWLAERWGELREEDIDATAKMMVGLFRRIGTPEGRT